VVVEVFDGVEDWNGLGKPSTIWGRWPALSRSVPPALVSPETARWNTSTRTNCLAGTNATSIV